MRYPAIERAFSLNRLKECCEKPPYYCHYMAYRLGTWQNECLFQRLEALLACAEKIPKWESEKSMLSSAEFADFWSLVWQLQVAEHLCEVGADVSWAESGPDLSVKTGNECWFVECYTFRKSFGLLRFLEDLLGNIDKDICIEYNLYMPFSLPQGKDSAEFLHQVLSPFLDPTFLEKKKEEAQQQYPVVLYKQPSKNNPLVIYVEGNDEEDGYQPGIITRGVGDPESYLEVVLKEAANAKRNSNDLKNNRPNLVAANCVLSEDFQTAQRFPERVRSMTLPEIAPNIDVLAVSSVGIDERLTKEKLSAVRLNKSDRINLESLIQIADISCLRT